MPNSPSQIIVVAIGGNSLISDSEHKTVDDQYRAVEQTCQHLAPLIRLGHRLVISHGNGPQVGFILRRSDLAAHELHRVPLDSCDADTQGAIGYQIQKSFFNVGRDLNIKIPLVSVVTQVRVDAADPAFAKPAKPIGSFMDAETAKQRQRELGWQIMEDAGRGFRRVVPSPRPLQIMELAAIRALIDQGFHVVAAGGGGIPVVVDEDGRMRGVEAVIDKDHASALLAHELKADMLLISTAVERVCLRFGQADAEAIESMNTSQAREYMQQGHFQPGSMLPKIEAMVHFVEHSGKTALLCDPQHLEAALAGRSGTRVTP